MFKPKMIQEQQTIALAAMLVDFEDAAQYPSLVQCYNQLLEEGWRFYVVDQLRGRCYYGPKVITLPLWVVAKPQGKYIQYVAHEMAHAVLAGHKLADAHGPEFMEALQGICPAEFLHYELSYKFKQAIAAGITPEDF